MGLTFRSKAKVSGGPIRWNHYFEAMAEESGTTVRLSYNLEVKAKQGHLLPVAMNFLDRNFIKMSYLLVYIDKFII